VQACFPFLAHTHTHYPTPFKSTRPLPVSLSPSPSLGSGYAKTRPHLEQGVNLLHSDALGMAVKMPRLTQVFTSTKPCGWAPPQTTALSKALNCSTHRSPGYGFTIIKCLTLSKVKTCSPRHSLYLHKCTLTPTASTGMTGFTWLFLLHYFSLGFSFLRP